MAASSQRQLTLAFRGTAKTPFSPSPRQSTVPVSCSTAVTAPSSVSLLRRKTAASASSSSATSGMVSGTTASSVSSLRTLPR